jgi:multiple sugar transport system permease protein
MRFIGLSNYKEIIRDPFFKLSLYNTLYYTLFSVPLGIATSIAIAIILNMRVRGVSVFRTIYYMPAVISGVAVSLLWLIVLDPSYGLVNYILSLFHIRGPLWLQDPKWSKPALILMSLWQSGGNMIIYLAGLQQIPEQLYEAATIDGANNWFKFWKITLPLLTPTIFLNLVLSIIGSFQIFTQAYVMTGGGPLNSTLFYVLYLYQKGFQSFEMGYASALAWILFTIVLLLTIILFRTSWRWVYYEAEVK